MAQTRNLFIYSLYFILSPIRAEECQTLVVVSDAAFIRASVRRETLYL
jgi:hypothetical protein